MTAYRMLRAAHDKQRELESEIRQLKTPKLEFEFDPTVHSTMQNVGGFVTIALWNKSGETIHGVRAQIEGFESAGGNVSVGNASTQLHGSTLLEPKRRHLEHTLRPGEHVDFLVIRTANSGAIAILRETSRGQRIGGQFPPGHYRLTVTAYGGGPPVSAVLTIKTNSGSGNPSITLQPPAV